MTSRTCPWCGGETLRRVGSNTLQDTRPGDHPYYINVVYWEDRECGYREVTTPDTRYDDDLKTFVDIDREVLRFHKPIPPVPIHMQPEYLRNGITTATVPKGQQVLGVPV